MKAKWLLLAACVLTGAAVLVWVGWSIINAVHGADAVSDLRACYAFYVETAQPELESNAAMLSEVSLPQRILFLETANPTNVFEHPRMPIIVLQKENWWETEGVVLANGSRLVGPQSRIVNADGSVDVGRFASSPEEASRYQDLEYTVVRLDKIIAERHGGNPEPL